MKGFYFKIVSAAVLAAALFAGFGLPGRANAQEIITAERYMEMVGDRYAGVKDYEARIGILSGSEEMSGTVSYLSPAFLRIDFAQPAEQVIVFNGEQLTVYIPRLHAALNQVINSNQPTASVATAQGLSLLRRNYVPAFVTGPDPTPLDPESQEKAVAIRLTRRSVSEGFREIILYINPDSLLIRRMEGRTIAESLVRFNFTDIRTNLGIPEGRFIYDSPASANLYNNFLFRDTE